MNVLAEMTRKGFGCVGVVDGEKLVGIITDGDLRRHMGPSRLNSSPLVPLGRYFLLMMTEAIIMSKP